MNCDLCNQEISAKQLVRIPIKEMQQAVRKGFNPFKTPGIDTSTSSAIATMFGLSADETFQDWRQRVMVDTSDWGLCSACEKAFRRASK